MKHEQTGDLHIGNGSEPQMTVKRANYELRAGIFDASANREFLLNTPNPFGIGQEALPSTGNLSTFGIMGEITRTFETTAGSGYLQATRDGEPITLTLAQPWVQKLIEGFGPKRTQYVDFIEKTCFFSDDEDRQRNKDRAYSTLWDATCCAGEFVSGDVKALLEDHRSYFQWLLGDGVPVRFLGHPSFMACEDGSEATMHDRDFDVGVTWNTVKPFRFDEGTPFLSLNVLSWEDPKSRFKVYIDGQFNVTYSFTFEETNISSSLTNQVPKGLALAVASFMERFPRP